MKRYFLFAGNNFYPQAGMDDFRGSFDEISEAIEEAANFNCDWWRIYDTQGEGPIGVKYGAR